MPKQSAAPKVRAKRVPNKPRKTVGGLTNRETSASTCGHFCLNQCPPIRSLADEYDSNLIEFDNLRIQLENTDRRLENTERRLENTESELKTTKRDLAKCEHEKFQIGLELMTLKNNLEDKTPRSTPRTTPHSTPKATGTVITPTSGRPRKAPRSSPLNTRSGVRNLLGQMNDVSGGRCKRTTVRS